MLQNLVRTSERREILTKSWHGPSTRHSPVFGVPTHLYVLCEHARAVWSQNDSVNASCEQSCELKPPTGWPFWVLETLK